MNAMLAMPFVISTAHNCSALASQLNGPVVNAAAAVVAVAAEIRTLVSVVVNLVTGLVTAVSHQGADAGPLRHVVLGLARDRPGAETVLDLVPGHRGAAEEAQAPEGGEIGPGRGLGLGLGRLIRTGRGNDRLRLRKSVSVLVLLHLRRSVLAQSHPQRRTRRNSKTVVPRVRKTLLVMPLLLNPLLLVRTKRC